MSIDKISVIKRVRTETGCGLKEAKDAVEGVIALHDVCDSELVFQETVRNIKAIYNGIVTSVGLLKHGRIQSRVDPEGKHAVMIEVKCETDFAANSFEFEALVRRLCHIAVEKEFTTLADLVGDLDVRERIAMSRGMLKEDLSVTRFVRWSI